jgi:shikimate kinase
MNSAFDRYFRETACIREYGRTPDAMKNIVLIGMPGAGKSTAGVILAKALRRHFLDTDIVIQEQAGRLLQEIIDTDGPDAFKKIEEETVLSLHNCNTVIATGGSVVFSERAMEHLKKDGVVVYLKISSGEMEKRLRNITTRGIVLSRGETLRDMYDERVPLYERYADITVDCSDEDFETVVGNVIEELEDRHVTGH